MQIRDGDYDLNKCEVGESIAIIGGGTLGLESAVTQSSRGKKVRVIELLPKLGAGSDVSDLLAIMEKNGVEMLTERRLVSVYPDRIVCTEIGTGKLEEYTCDTVLLSAGMAARRDFAESMRRLLPETEVYIVGDAKAPRSLGDAVHDGFNAAINI